MTTQASDIKFMRLAIDASRDAAEQGNTPFGAVLARGDTMLLVAGNTEISGSDCTAHAELALIRKAQQQFGQQVFQDATLYASGEPCAMCAAAMFWAGIRRILYAATKDDIEQALGAPNLPIDCRSTLAGANPPVHIEGPLLREEAAAVLQQFGRPR